MLTGKRLLGTLVLTAVTATAATAQSAPGSAVPPRNLALIGVTQVGDLTRAWLVDLDTNRRETAGPGGLAFGYRVKQVGPDRVVLTRSGRQFVLRLGDRDVPVREAPVVRGAPGPAPETVEPAVPVQPRIVELPPDEEPLPVEDRAVTPARAEPEVRLEREEPLARGGYTYVPGYGYVFQPPAYDPTLGGYPFPNAYPDPYGYSGAYGYPGPAGYPGAYGYVGPYGYPAPDYGYSGPYGGAGYGPGAPGYGSPSIGQPFMAPGAMGFPGQVSPYGAALRSNPQTTRRRSGDFFSPSTSTNPQTLRRRTLFGWPNRR